MSGYSICSEEGDNLCFLRVHQLRVESVFEFNFILQWCGSQPSIFGMMVHALLFPVFVSTSTFQQSSWPLEMITICGICDMYFANKKKFPFWWWAQNFKYLLMRSFLNVLVDLIKFFVIALPFTLVFWLKYLKITSLWHLFQTAQQARSQGLATVPSLGSWCLSAVCSSFQGT